MHSMPLGVEKNGAGWGWHFKENYMLEKVRLIWFSVNKLARAPQDLGTTWIADNCFRLLHFWLPVPMFCLVWFGFLPESFLWLLDPILSIRNQGINILPQWPSTNDCWELAYINTPAPSPLGCHNRDVCSALSPSLFSAGLSSSHLQWQPASKSTLHWLPSPPSHFLNLPWVVLGSFCK